MSFKKCCKQLFIKSMQNGTKVTIIHGQLEFTGVVVEFENLSVQDAHVTLETKEQGKVTIPITSNMILVEPNDEVEDDEVEVEKPKPSKKSSK